jgi:hypothetical protein
MRLMANCLVTMLNWSIGLYWLAHGPNHGWAMFSLTCALVSLAGVFFGISIENTRKRIKELEEQRGRYWQTLAQAQSNSFAQGGGSYTGALAQAIAQQGTFFAGPGTAQQAAGTYATITTLSGGGAGGGGAGGGWVHINTFPGGISQVSGMGTFGGVGTFGPMAPLHPIIENAGISAGEIIAHRCWRVGNDGYLYSMAMSNYRWPAHEPAGLMLAAPSGLFAPQSLEYGAGIHGFKDTATMETYSCYWKTYASSVPHDPVHAIVFGTVALWGDVIEHEGGYRAEFGAINSLDEYWERSGCSQERAELRLLQLRRLYGLEEPSNANE